MGLLTSKSFFFADVLVILADLVTARVISIVDTFCHDPVLS